ncbi:hypothetical protein KR054_003373, partial [Drosophila jambulina]
MDIRNAFNTADGNRTLESLAALNIPGYLMGIVRSFLSERTLVVDTNTGSRAYEVSAGPLLWNTMYDGELRLPMPTDTKIVGFADDIANANSAIRAIEAWLLNAGLELAAHKTEAVLISSRKKIETGQVLVRGTAIK